MPEGGNLQAGGEQDEATRKKIKKVMSDKKLSATTKEAQQVETDRLKKLKEFARLAGAFCYRSGGQTEAATCVLGEALGTWPFAARIESF